MLIVEKIPYLAAISIGSVSWGKHLYRQRPQLHGEVDRGGGGI